MHKILNNRWIFVWLLSLAALSCDNDDDEPEPKVHGANFEYEIAPEGEGLRYIFTNTSANAESAIWLFGDGTTDDEMSPTHEYAEAGTYEVTLISIGVENSEPVTAQITQTIEVELAPIPACDVKAENLNFIKNGEFESDEHWTVNSLSGAGLANADFDFGSDEAPACTNTGKGFHLNNLVPFENNGNLIWQSLGVLEVGRYRFSGDANIVTGENSANANDPDAGKNYFVEVFLVDEAPEDGKSLSGDVTPRTLVSGFNAWEGGASNDIPTGKGSFPVRAYQYNRQAWLLADNRGDFEITEEKEYFIAIQFGTYGGSYGTGGISIDNFAITRLPD